MQEFLSTVFKDDDNLTNSLAVAGVEKVLQIQQALEENKLLGTKQLNKKMPDVKTVADKWAKELTNCIEAAGKFPDKYAAKL
jgi:hypothetical protein